MDDSVLDKAKLRLEALEREAQELRSFIRMYVRLSGLTSAPTPTSTYVNGHSHLRNSDSEYSSREEIVEAARDVLKKVHPRPLMIGDLFQALIDRGIKISGQNPKGNLSAKLAPPKDIVYVKDEGWYYRPNENGGAAALSEAKVRPAGNEPDFHNSQSSPGRQ